MEKRRRGVRSEGCALGEAVEEKVGDSTVTEETAQDMIIRRRICLVFHPVLRQAIDYQGRGVLVVLRGGI